MTFWQRNWESVVSGVFVVVVGGLVQAVIPSPSVAFVPFGLLVFIAITVGWAATKWPERLKAPRIAPAHVIFGALGLIAFLLATYKLWNTPAPRDTVSAFLPDSSVTTPHLKKQGKMLAVTMGMVETPIPYEPIQYEQFEDLQFQNLRLFPWGLNLPVRIYVDKDSNILVNAQIFGPYSGVPPVTIRHNQVTSDFASFHTNWDHNSNDKALEIVNESQEPVFQMIFKDPDQIILRGVFAIIPSNEVILMDGAFPSAYDLPEDQKTFGPLFLRHTKRLFKYPHQFHPGELDTQP